MRRVGLSLLAAAAVLPLPGLGTGDGAVVTGIIGIASGSVPVLTAGSTDGGGNDVGGEPAADGGAK